MLQGALHVDPIYLKQTYPDATDFRHFGTSLSRRTKSLKIWFLLRSYGLEGIQAYVKRVSSPIGNPIIQGTLRSYEVKLASHAQRMKGYIEADKRLEIVGDVHLSLVCFRVKVRRNCGTLYFNIAQKTSPKL